MRTAVRAVSPFLGSGDEVDEDVLQGGFDQADGGVGEALAQATGDDLDGVGDDHGVQEIGRAHV